MKTVHLVIFFVFAMAQLSYAQNVARSTSAPVTKFESKAQEQAFVREFVNILPTTSAFNFTNEKAVAGYELDVNKGRKSKLMFSEQSKTKRFWMDVHGDYTLLDVSASGSVSELTLRDTTLKVAVLDLSKWGVRVEAVDESDPRFLCITQQIDKNGNSRLVKSYNPAKDEDDSANTNASASAKSVQATAASDSLSNSPSVDSLNTPELVRKDNLGRRDVLSFYNPSTEMYEVVYDGRRSRWPYRNDMSWKTRNGLYGNSGYGLVSNSWYQPQSFGGGYNNFGYGGNYGYGGGYGGCYGGGFSAGINISLGWSSGYGGCMGGQYGYANRWATGGPAVWNGYELVAIQQGFGGYNYGNYGGGYYDDGYGYKSNTTNVAGESEEFVEFASAEFKNSPSVNQGHEAERFVDFGSTTASASKERSSQNANDAIAMQNPPTRSTKELPRSHGGGSYNNAVASKDVPASHSRVSDSKPGVNRTGNNGQVRTPSTQPRATPSRNAGGMNRTAPSNGPSRNGGARPSSTPSRGTVAPNRNAGGSMRAKPMRSAAPSRSKR